MLKRELVHTIITKRGESQQHFNLLRVRVINQFTNKILLHILVLTIVFPGDWILFGCKSAADPKNDHIRPVLLEAVQRILPLRKASERHSHERDIITPEGLSA